MTITDNASITWVKMGILLQYLGQNIVEHEEETTLR